VLEFNYDLFLFFPLFCILYLSVKKKNLMSKENIHIHKKCKKIYLLSQKLSTKLHNFYSLIQFFAHFLYFRKKIKMAIFVFVLLYSTLINQ